MTIRHRRRRSRVAQDGATITEKGVRIVSSQAAMILGVRRRRQRHHVQVRGIVRDDGIGEGPAPQCRRRHRHEAHPGSGHLSRSARSGRERASPGRRGRWRPALGWRRGKFDAQSDWRRAAGQSWSNRRPHGGARSSRSKRRTGQRPMYPPRRLASDRPVAAARFRPPGMRPSIAAWNRPSPLCRSNRCP